ncbi:MAG: flagellar brake protein [Azoarcus sp.]|jgi:c-di-GMP-binding flagellar brake protein YcgR|nr:flagellar brake protein [Azoarcus sp.]
MPNQTDNEPVFNPMREDELEHYLLRGRQQIRHLLQDMIEARALISVHMLPGALSFLSAILTLSEDEEWIFLDASPNETIHRRALEAERLLCITQLNKIRIQFRLSNSAEVPVDGHVALAAPIPAEILRLQRRDAFRLQVPLSHNLKCVLPASEWNAKGDAGDETAPRRTIEAPVIDVSASGLSLEIAADKAAPVVGDTINGCCLKLPKDLVSVNLEIRNHGRRILGDGKEVLRLGCSFIALPTHAANQIQRYIYQTEREIRAHRPG